MDFELLYRPLEHADSSLSGLIEGAPLIAALGLAFLLGLRHASDPDHLVAATSLMSSEAGDVRAGARVGAWWGMGHAAALLTLGVPLILLGFRMPAGIEAAAEHVVGLVILLLAARLGVRWLHGGYRADGRDLLRPRRPRVHRDGSGGQRGARRTLAQAAGIGLLHGLGGTGAVAVLLIAALPQRCEAAAALAVFAPMSMLSMTACTAAFAWVLTRPRLQPVYRTTLIPALSAFGLLFGASYTGLL